MAGFQLTLHGRFWVTPEATKPTRLVSVSPFHPSKLLQVLQEFLKNSNSN
jgi:hypothetical protein